MKAKMRSKIITLQLAILFSIFNSGHGETENCRSYSVLPPSQINLDELIISGVKRIQAALRGGQGSFNNILVMGSSQSDMQAVSQLLLFSNNGSADSSPGSPAIVNSLLVNSTNLTSVLFQFPSFDQTTPELQFGSLFLTSYVGVRLQGKIKVLIVVPSDFVTSPKRSFDFDKIVTATVQLFKGYRRNMFASFGLVVTAPGGDEGEVVVTSVESVGEFLQNYAGKLSDRRDAARRAASDADEEESRRQEIDRKLDLLNSFTKQKYEYTLNKRDQSGNVFSRIVILRRGCHFPTQNDSFHDKERLSQLLTSNLDATSVTPDTFHFHLDKSILEKIWADFVPHALSRIKEVVTPLETQLTQHYSSIEGDQSKDAVRLKEVYGKLIDLFLYDKMSPDGNREEWVKTHAEKLELALKFSKMEDQLATTHTLFPAYALEEAVKFLSALDKVHPLVSPEQSWKLGETLLKTISDSISNTSQTTISCQNRRALVSGISVKFSDFLSVSNGFPCGGSGLEELVVSASDTVYIDRDIESRGGVPLKMSLIGDTWELIGSHRKIVLDGATGSAHFSAGAANAQDFGGNGTDGLPGNPGGNGGLFLGIYRTVSRNGIQVEFNTSYTKSYKLVPNSLTISAKAGKGGRGQDGGAGKGGLPGKNAGIEEFPMTHRLVGEAGDIKEKFKGLFYKMGEYYVRRGRKGGNGGDGGRRGSGGKPGRPGVIEVINIRDKWEEIPFTRHLCKGAEGEPGEYGKAGEGGRGGTDYGCKFDKEASQWTGCKQLVRKTGLQGEYGSVEMYLENGKGRKEPQPLPFPGYFFGKALTNLKAVPSHGEKQREFLRMIGECSVVKEKCITVKGLQEKLVALEKLSGDYSRLAELKVEYPQVLETLSRFAAESQANAGGGVGEKKVLNYIYATGLSGLLASSKMPCVRGESLEEARALTESTLRKMTRFGNGGLSYGALIGELSLEQETSLAGKLRSQQETNGGVNRVLGDVESLVKGKTEVALKQHNLVRRGRSVKKLNFDEIFTLQMFVQTGKLVQYTLLAANPSGDVNQTVAVSKVVEALRVGSEDRVGNNPLHIPVQLQQALKGDMEKNAPQGKFNLSLFTEQLEAAWKINEKDVGEELRPYLREFRSALWEMRDSSRALNFTGREKSELKNLIGYLVAPVKLQVARELLVYQVLHEVIKISEDNGNSSAFLSSTGKEFILQNKLGMLENVTKVLEIGESTDALHDRVEKLLLGELRVAQLKNMFPKDATMKLYEDLRERQNNIQKLLSQFIDLHGNQSAGYHHHPQQEETTPLSILKNVKLQLVQVKHLLREEVRSDTVSRALSQLNDGLEQAIEVYGDLDRFQKIKELDDYIQNLKGFPGTPQVVPGIDQLEFLIGASLHRILYNEVVHHLACTQVLMFPYEYGYVLQEEDGRLVENLDEVVKTKNLSAVATSYYTQAQGILTLIQNTTKSGGTKPGIVVNFHLISSRNRTPTTSKSYLAKNEDAWGATVQNMFLGYPIRISEQVNNRTVKLNETGFEPLEGDQEEYSNLWEYHLRILSNGPFCSNRIKELALSFRLANGSRVMYRFEKLKPPSGFQYLGTHQEPSQVANVFQKNGLQVYFKRSRWTVEIRNWDESCGIVE